MKNEYKQIDADIANEFFVYKDGALFWKVQISNRIKAGNRAGCKHNGGYRVIRFNKEEHLEHRVIYTMLKGKIPDGFQIDHKDRNKSNNSIENLRVSTHSKNGWNTTKPKNNTSGYKGVSAYKNSWVANIFNNGEPKYLGIFKTPELASEAYKKAILEFRGKEYIID